MRTTTHALALAAALVTAATPLTTTTLAQPQGDARQQQDAREKWPGPGVLRVEQETPYFDLDFKGGTVQEYVEYISKQLGYPNFFVEIEARDIELVPVKLDNISLDYALSLINNLHPASSRHDLDWTEYEGVFRLMFTAGAPDPSQPSREPVSLEFPGGTALDFINAVQAAAGEDRVFMQGELTAFKFPPMKLTNTPLRDLVLSMDDTAALDSNGNQIMLRVEDMGGVYKVSTISRGPQAQPRQVAVFPLAQIIAAGFTSAEDTLSAIEAAIESDPAAAKTTSLRFHQPTNILIVNATPDAIATVESVLATLQHIAEGAERLREGIASRRIELVRAQARVDTFNIRSEELTSRLIRLEELAEQDAVADETVHQNRRDMRIANAEFSAAQNELAIILEQLQALERQLETYRGNPTN